jgi:alpha-beta hydrolase superfamily lysophospholipase
MRRTLLVNLLIPNLGKQPLAAPFDWVTKPLVGLAARIGTARGRRNRRALSDGTSFLAGDIILYQVRGEQIRRFICDCIGGLDQEVAVLGHSLGGIAAVDVLVQNDFKDRVKALITVGSQAPFFYEINGLASLPFGKKLRIIFPASG